MNFSNSRFKVQIGDLDIDCVRVKNLTFNVEYTTTRVGGDLGQTAENLLGNKIYEPVLLERPLQNGINTFFDLWNAGNPKKEDKKHEISTLTIQLLDNQMDAVAIWILTNPQFVKLSYSDLDAQGNEILTEILEVIHEGITVSMP
jgi:phage tail-like protein